MTATLFFSIRADMFLNNILSFTFIRLERQDQRSLAAPSYKNYASEIS